MNLLVDPWYDQYEALWRAGSGEIAPVVAGVAAIRDAVRVAGTRLIDPMVIWPETVIADITAISDMYFARQASYGAISSARTYDQVVEATWPVETSEQTAAAPRVRAILACWLTQWPAAKDADPSRADQVRASAL